MVLSCTIVSVAKTSYEYVKYGSGLELIIKTETHWGKDDTKTYGLRKNGIEIIKPEYDKSAIFVADDLPFLVFACWDKKTAYIYNTNTGKKIFTHQYKKYDANAHEYFIDFQFKETVVNGQKGWQLIEVLNRSATSYRAKTRLVVATFYQKNGKLYQRKTKTVTYDEEIL